MKEKIIREYKRRLRLVLKSKLNGKNKIQAVNTWAVAILRYGAGIIDWKGDDLKQLDRSTRKTLTMYGAFHPRSDVDRLYVKRREGGRGLISVEACVKLEENNLGLYVHESNEMLLKGVKNVKVIETEHTVEKAVFKRRQQNDYKNRWQEKRMYGQYVREMTDDIDRHFHGIGLLAAIVRYKQRQQYLQPKNKPCELIMSKTELMERSITLCVECVGKKVRQYNTLYASVRNWPSGNIKGGTTTLLSSYIGK